MLRRLRQGDDGATAVEYGLLTVITVLVAGVVYLFVPTLNFGLPQFAKFGMGRGEDGGGAGGSTSVAGSGAELAGQVSDRIPGNPPVRCPDYPSPSNGTLVSCTNEDTSATITVRYTSATEFTLVR